MLRKVAGVPRSEKRMVTWWMDSGVRDKKVPKHVGVLTIGGRMPLLGVDEVGKFQGVPDEKYRGIVAHQIVIALFRVELDGEPPGVPGGVGEPFSPPTVENRAKTSVRLPTSERNLALV